jgi:hypothetical protein
MSDRTSALKSGLAWILLSPLALLMALISTVESLTVYYVQVALVGAWAASGIVAGIARIATVSWAGRLQRVLLWIAFAYFCVCAVLIAVYLLLFLFRSEPEPFGLVLFIAVGVFLTSLPFLYFARRRTPQARSMPTPNEKPPHENTS